MIIARTKIPLMKEQALRDGMKPLRDDGWAKVFAGITSADEVTRITKADRF